MKFNEKNYKKINLYDVITLKFKENIHGFKTIKILVIEFRAKMSHSYPEAIRGVCIDEQLYADGLPERWTSLFQFTAPIHVIEDFEFEDRSILLYMVNMRSEFIQKAIESMDTENASI